MAAESRDVGPAGAPQRPAAHDSQLALRRGVIEAARDVPEHRRPAGLSLTVEPASVRPLGLAQHGAALGGVRPSHLLSPQRLANALQRLRDRHPPIDASFSPPVRELLHAIHESAFEASFNVRALKRRCRMRDNNVSSRFKHEVGVSIRAYIEALRLDAARELLQRGECTAAEAGPSVGYAYAQTFYRAFKKRFGVCPGAVSGAGDRKVMPAAVWQARPMPLDRRRTLASAMDRILPSDEGPGATTANAIAYVDWLSMQESFAPIDARLTSGLALLDRWAVTIARKPFADCDAAQRDEVLRALQRVPHASVQEFWWLLIRLTIRGFLCDPRYGGNGGAVGWRYIGFTPFGAAGASLPAPQ